MTSAAKTTERAPGFTLIEIVMVLAIAAIVMAGAVSVMVYSSDEHKLRNASGEVEMLAKRARTTAILQQTPYALEFREGIVRLMPLAEAGREENFTVGGHKIGGETEHPAGGEHREFSWDADMEVYIRRWDSEKWLPTAGKDSIHIWRFDPNGLCEPLSIRYVMEKSWNMDSYNPLTATVRYNELEAR